ncbi:single-stranded DNA-binding protein [Peptostreptococcus equinus]|uniref:Single-stranded DNA-binding protein n=1 Tax=Peptostreptococcus equinus TaxID=3003601 RepID=A0ABY7JMM6_9FIRM|nr:single-stranded DNA-binding protein [Peptostreptococcus sp. CBA3647]WAW14621.1 single-stranded DNA-binding protein [Peptostreptococcus sp. CBA3647]WAW15268.1 single-stranded DNA-binding protein [Peptostreptococcus sp. CBA3647]
MNNTVLVGRLCKDPELRYIPGSGTPVATFTLAIDRDYKNKDGSTTTDFIPVEVMGKPAEFCANYITKGRLVGIQGSIRVDRYETPNGEKRNFTKVAGRNIQALDYANDDKGGNPKFEPSGSVGSSEFNSIDDDDVPF